MEQHALAILQQGWWNWPPTKRTLKSGERKWEIDTTKFLYHLIVESQKFGGSVLNLFWEQLGSCNERLKENIESLKGMDFESADKSFEILFCQLDPQHVDFGPVEKMAADYFTHLGIAFMNPGGKKSGPRSEHSVSEIVSKATDKVLKEVSEEGHFGHRKQELLKELSFNRDGDFCLLTGWHFFPSNPRGVHPALAHIIPNSVHGKTDTLNCIAMFAGDATRDNLIHNLNTLGNVMNMERNAHESYDRLEWGIEAKEEGGEVKYFFRTVPTDPFGLPQEDIKLREGEEIIFGQGHDGKQLNKGPLKDLCNLQLAVARVMKMSAAADIILQWKHEADDDGCYGSFVASEEYCDILDAKLLLSGRAVIA